MTVARLFRLTAGLLVACLAGLGSAEQTDLPHALLIAGKSPNSVSDRYDLYQTYCASCHGGDLRGGRGPDLRDAEWRHGSSRNDIAEVIRQGVPEQGMPAYGTELSDEQIYRLVELVQREQLSDESTPRPRANGKATEILETLDYAVGVEVWVDNLEVPWGIAFIDAETALVTERPGRLRLVQNGQLQPEIIEGTPAVHVPEGTQGGLLDIALDPEYQGNGWVYLSYSHASAEVEEGKEHRPSMLRVVRGRIRDNQWVDEQLVLESPEPNYPTTPPYHYGGRLLFGTDGILYVTIGDRYSRQDAQDLSFAHGKIHRVDPDGGVPEDNPFVQRQGAIPTIFSYGHRNPQGLTIHPETGALWAAEHGPMGGDELNIVTPGTNYGWPTITYGINYDGSVLTPHRRHRAMAQPVLYWRPSIAVSGIAFYDGNLFPHWRGKLLVGALKQQELRLLDIEGNRVMHQEVLMKDRGRVRQVTVGPDGAVYVLMHEPGKILRLSPREERFL